MDIPGRRGHLNPYSVQPDRIEAMPDAQAAERRRYPRFNGLHLMANIGGKLVKVAQISAGGMTLEAGFTAATEPMRFILYPSDDGKLDINHGVGGICRMVREDQRTVALRFDPATYRLVKFIAACSDAGPEKDSFLTR
jgi:hypothetical protein